MKKKSDSTTLADWVTLNTCSGGASHRKRSGKLLPKYEKTVWKNSIEKYGI